MLNCIMTNFNLEELYNNETKKKFWTNFSDQNFLLKYTLPEIYFGNISPLQQKFALQGKAPFGNRLVGNISEQ